MGYFSAAQRAAMQGHAVTAALVAHFDFLDAPQRLWGGAGLLRVGGQEYRGLGSYISVDGLSRPSGTEASQVRFTMSGVDPTLIDLTEASSDKVKFREVTVMLASCAIVTRAGVPVLAPFGADPNEPQFLDPFPDDPLVVWVGVMDQMRRTVTGVETATITVTAENYNYDRRRAPFALMTDRDQQLRHPGDKGLQQLALMRNSSEATPW